MRQTSQYLNNLYYELISNSPQTVSMDIPMELGSGRVSQTTTKQGVVLSDWNMSYSSDMNVQGANSDGYIQIIFCFHDGLSWNMMKDSHAVSIHKGESCIYRGRGEVEYTCYTKGNNFLFKSVKIPVVYFSRLLTDYFEHQEISVYEKKLFSAVSKIRTTPAMERIFAELKDFVHYRGGLGYLYLDSKVLELLSIYLGEVLELDIATGGKIALSRTDSVAILEAKRILDSQISYAPSCEELARSVHISMSKLTKGFSAMFGMPVHSYVIDQRLTKAAQLLVENDMNISQIASLVGYAKPSNFSEAFKKKFGVMPKSYKDTQIID